MRGYEKRCRLAVERKVGQPQQIDIQMMHQIVEP